MRQIKISKALLTIFFLLSVFPGQADAQPTAVADCLGCHTDVSLLTVHSDTTIPPLITWGTYYGGITTTGNPASITVNAGDSFEVEYSFQGMTTAGAGLNNSGVRVAIATPTNWTVAAPGAANQSILGSWNTVWNNLPWNDGATNVNADFSGSWPNSPQGHYVVFDGTNWLSGSAPGAAFDDGSSTTPGDLDGTSDLMGADALITVPGSANGTYTIKLYGVGHIAEGTKKNPSNTKAAIIGSITVTVNPGANDPPTFDGTPPANATEDTPYSYSAAATDPQSDPMTWNVLGSDTCGGAFAGNVYSFTPTGPAPPASCTLAIEVCDDAPACTQQSATITITAVNDPPTIITSAGTSATEDTLYSYNADATDADGPAPLAWSTIAGDTCGGSIDSGTGVYTFTPTGPVPPANCAIAIQVCDNNGAGLCTPETATVNITAVNDAPAITTSAPSTATEDVPYSYDADFADPDGTGENWTLNVSNSCPGSAISSTGVYTFTPTGPSPPASCVLDIRICDNGSLCDTETVTINITAVNDPPVGTADSYSTPQNTVLNEPAPGVLGNDSDPEGAALTAQNPTATDVGGSSLSLNADGSFTFTPKNNYTGADGFSYDVCDPAASCVTVRVDITVTAGGNNPPTFDGSPPTTATEDTLYSYTAAATDPESDPLTWGALGTDTCGGSFAGNVYSFTPSGPTPPASCDLAIQVCDDAPACTQQSATITITAVNDAPAITTTTPTNAVTGNLFTYDADVSDPDGPGATWSLLGGHTCGGALDAATGIFTFTPAAAGSCELNIRVCDGGSPDLCDIEGPTTITITDTAVLTGHNYDVNGGVSLDCNTCHALHGGSMVPTANEVYTACTQCHNSTTFPDAADERLWDVANHTVATESAPATIITVDCGQCHEVHKNALQSDASDLEAGGGVSRNLAYIRVDMSKYIPGALTNTVFQEKPDHFAEYEATGVGAVLNGVCQSCHTDTKYHKNTATGTDHKLSVGGPPNNTDCKACHKHGTGDEATNATGGSFAASGGHSDTDFGWDGNCKDCHGGGTGTEAVVSVIHGDNCNLCHTNPTGTTDATSEGPGPVANGVDGDASLANGDAGTWAATCTTCHDVTDPDVNAASMGGIHHDNTTDGLVSTDAQCTSRCHNVTNHKGGHDTVGILNSANCNNCHTATAGAADGSAPLDSGDPKIHDSCMVSCHAIAGTPAANGTLQAKTAPGGSADISAGDCNNCHGAYFINHDHHTLATNKVTTHTDCSGCHDATAGGNARDAIAPAYVGSGEVHNTTAGGDGCAACHNVTNGSLVSLAGTADPGTDGTATNFSCRDCHTQTWRNIHGPTSPVFSHASAVQNSASCNWCHGNSVAGSNARDAVTPPFNAAGEVHATNSCLTCHNADGSLRSSGLAKADQVTPGACTGCHANTSTWTTIHEAALGTVQPAVDHTTRVDNTSGACDACHGNGVAGSNARDAAARPFTGAGEVHAANNCATCHNADGTIKSSGFTKADQIVNGDCLGCHVNSSTWTSIHDGASGVTHASRVTAAAVCTACHDAGGSTDARATSASPYINAGDVHNTTANGNRCAACHDGGNDGGFKAPANTDQITAGDCLGCHTNTSSWATIHDSAGGIDHSQEVANLATCTSSCHTATGGFGTGQIASLINSGDDKVHDACSTCHDGDGVLLSKAAANVNGYVLGAGMAAGDCGQCHTSTYFDSHVHGQDGGYADHLVTFAINGLDGNAGTTGDNDTSQPTSQGCDACHLPLGTAWTGINDEHDVATNGSGSCATCHNSTRNTGIDGYTDVPDVIATTTGASCDTCHDDKTPNISHGGHSDSHFGWDGGCIDCHSTANDFVVSEVHSNNCDTCHVDGGPYNAGTEEIGSATNGVDGNATLANGNAGTWNATCTTCHPPATYPGAVIHHDTANAAAGNCEACHTDPRPAVGNIPYKQMPCQKCHIVSDGGSGIKAIKFTLKDPYDGANGTWAATTQTDVPGHLWPATTSIQNYGACYYCHGKTGLAAGRATKTVVPLHALPNPTDGSTTADVGALNTIDINLMGGGGWQEPEANWSFDGTGADFRGSHSSNNTGKSPDWPKMYFPIGKEVMNIGYGRFAQPKQASNNTGYKNNNAGLYYDPSFNIPAGMKWGYVEPPHAAGTGTAGTNGFIMPIFDANPQASLGVDTLSENTAFSVNWVNAADVGPINTRTITIDVSSTDPGATLYLVFGGTILGTGTGSISGTWDLHTEAVNRVGTANNSEYALFHSPLAPVFWIVSSSGGSLTLSGHPNQGQGHN